MIHKDLYNIETPKHFMLRFGIRLSSKEHEGKTRLKLIVPKALCFNSVTYYFFKVIRLDN